MYFLYNMNKHIHLQDGLKNFYFNNIKTDNIVRHIATLKNHTAFHVFWGTLKIRLRTFDTAPDLWLDVLGVAAFTTEIKIAQI